VGRGAYRRNGAKLAFFVATLAPLVYPRLRRDNSSASHAVTIERYPNHDACPVSFLYTLMLYVLMVTSPGDASVFVLATIDINMGPHTPAIKPTTTAAYMDQQSTPLNHPHFAIHFLTLVT